MVDNTDIVPSRFIVKNQGLRDDIRTYKCRRCGWTTPPVKDGKELREAVRQGHLCLSR
jgi:hypothetical protein